MLYIDFIMKHTTYYFQIICYLSITRKFEKKKKKKYLFFFFCPSISTYPLIKPTKKMHKPLNLTNSRPWSNCGHFTKKKSLRILSLGVFFFFPPLSLFSLFFALGGLPRSLPPKGAASGSVNCSSLKSIFRFGSR